VTSDEAVKAALKVWVERLEVGAGQETAMRAAIEAALDVDQPLHVPGNPADCPACRKLAGRVEQ
jgi:hypothetical protein